jgi:hypothetical protein
VDAVSWVAGSMPIRQGFREAGVTRNDVIIFSGLMDLEIHFLTVHRLPDGIEADAVVRGIAQEIQRVGLERTEPERMPAAPSTPNMMALIASAAEAIRA